MAEENQAAETDQPEGDDGSDEAPPADSSEETEASPEPSEEAGASGEGAGDEAPPDPPPEEPPEDPVESLAGVKAVRVFLGDEVEEVTSFTGGADEAAMTVPAGRIRALCAHLKAEHGFNYLSDLCGVHYPEREKPFEVVYQLLALDRAERLRLKVRLADGEAALSVVGVWRTADWLEREAFDMFGIEFEGHPDLRRILLPEDWEGFPLRKDYPVRGDGFGLTWVERQIPSASRPVTERK